MKCLGAWALLALSSTAASGQEQPLRVVDIRIPWGPPQALRVIFNQPVAPDTWPPSRIPTGIHIVPAVRGRYDWPDSVTLRFTPIEPLAPGVYAVTLDSTFTGRDGARLERPLTYRLEPEVLRTHVVLRRPGAGLDDPLDLVFSRRAGVAGAASERAPPGITLTPATAGRWVWLDSLRLRFTPTSPFASGVRYAIAVDSTLRDPSGVAVRAIAVVHFPDPIWVAWHRLPASPTDGIVLQFNAPITLGAAPESLLTINPPVDGGVALPDSMTLQFTPRTAFKPGVHYFVRLSDELRAVNGARLVASGWTGQFGFWLRLVEGPVDVVPPRGPFTFRFNHRLQRPSDGGRRLPRGFRFDPPVRGHVEWPDSQTLRFVPDAALTSGGRYRVVLGLDLVTPDGFRLTDSLSVTIRPGMRVGSYVSSGLSRVAPITIGVVPLISRQRDTMVPPRGFHLDPPTAGTLWWTRTGQIEFRPDSMLQPGTEYRLSFDTTFRAPDGTALLEPTTLRVRTRGRAMLAAWPPATFVSGKTRFRFVLSEPIDPGEFADSVRLAVQGYYRPGHPCRALAAVRFRPQRPRALRPSDSLFADVLRDSVLLDRAPPTLLTLIPDRELPAGCMGTLTVTGLVEWPFQRSFQTPGEFRLRSGAAPTELTFTTPVSESELLQHVQVSPPLPFRFVEGPSPPGQPATMWRLDAAFTPATTYRVSVDGGLRDAFGQRLAAAVEDSFTTEPARPTVAYQSTHHTVPTGTIPRVDVTSIHVSELRVCTARVPDSARQRLIGDGWWTWRGIDSVTSESTECARLAVHASTSDSVRSTVAVPWKAAWRARPAGLYAARVSSPEAPVDPRTPSMVVFHVTDLAVLARLDRDRATVLVVRRANGAPVPRAAVTMRTCSGDVIATAATDDSGLAELAGMAAAEAATQERYACEESSWRTLEVTTRDDYETMNVPMHEDARTLVGPLPASLLIPDRLVYRRGDTIRVQALVRGPPLTSIRWVVVGRRPDRLEPQRVRDTVVALSRAGTAELAISVGHRLPAGLYQTALLVRRADLWLQVAGATFWVSEAPAPRVHLSVVPERRWGARGDSTRVTLAAWNQNGTPVRGVVDVRWVGGRLHSYEGVRVPRDFTTGEIITPGGGVSPEAIRGRRTVTLDAAGEGSFNLPLPERAPSWPWRLALQATMQGASRSTETGHATVDVYPAALNLVIRTSRDARDPPLGARDSVEVVALRPNGTPFPGVRIDGLLAGRRWSPAPQESDSLPGPAGAMGPDTLDRCSALTTDRPARCVLRRFAQGYATVSFSAADSQDRRVEIAQSVSYPRDPGWISEVSPAAPALAVDRVGYVVGDTAVVRIENVEHGAIAWLTVASGDHVEGHLLRPFGQSDTVRLPIVAHYAPRVTLTATIWDADSSGRPSRAATTSQIELAVRDPAERMAVTLQLPQRAEAASTHRIAITGAVGPGAPDEARILVWAIDERLAAVDSLRLRDVAGVLLRPPPARRLAASSLEDPAPVPYVPIDPGSEVSTGMWPRIPEVLEYGPWGERGARQLEDVPGPFLLGAGRTGRDGTATLDVRLPDAAGRYRVIAVALTRVRVGMAEGVITVEPGR